jgi:hypothetical protein
VAAAHASLIRATLTHSGETSDLEAELAPNPFAKVDEETAYLRGQLEKRDRKLKELDAKISLYEEYQRQKSVGMCVCVLVCVHCTI